MADYPNAKLKQTNVPTMAGHTGVVTDSGVEGTAKFSGKDSIGTNSAAKNKKSAGNVGASNVNAGTP